MTAEILRRLDDALVGVELPKALQAARTLVRVLERRLEEETKPLDLFTLPLDLPTWEELYADLVARAISETGSLRAAAKVIGVGRSSLYSQVSKGLLDAHARSDPDLARVLGSVLGPVAGG